MFFLQSFALKCPNLQVDCEDRDDQWDLGRRFLLEEKRPTQKPIFLIDKARNTKKPWTAFPPPFGPQTVHQGPKKLIQSGLSKVSLTTSGLPSNHFCDQAQFLCLLFVINSSHFGIEWD